MNVKFYDANLDKILHKSLYTEPLKIKQVAQYERPVIMRKYKNPSKYQLSFNDEPSSW